MPIEIQNPHLLQTIAINTRILRVNMEHLVFELVDRRNGVDKRPDQVRGVVVHPETAAGDIVEESAPHLRANKEVLAARPLVLREEHGAILDANTKASVLRLLHDRPPYVQDGPPLLINHLLGMPTDEGIDLLDSQSLGGGHHLAKVRSRNLSLLFGRRERIGVVAETGNRNPVSATS